MRRDALTKYRDLLRTVAPAAALLLALLLGFAAFALLEWVSVGSTPDPQRAGGDDELALWQLLIAGEVVVWTLLAAIGWATLREFKSSVPAPGSISKWRRRFETTSFVLFIVLAALLLLGLQWLAGLKNPTVLPGQQWKNFVLHIVALLAIVPFLVTLKRIQLVAANAPLSPNAAEDVEVVRELRRDLRTATACLGVIVALAVLATGALRNAVAAAELSALPETYVLLYGAWFTAIVGGIYLWVFGAVESRARRILSGATAPAAADVGSSPDPQTIRERRRALSDELELGGDARKNLEDLIAVFSPLIGALLSRFAGV